MPLSRLWGGTRDAVPVGESFPICDTVDALHEEVAARVAEGFGRIKLKIAPGWDVEPARAMREAFPDLPVSVDANCGYAAGDPVFADLDELGLLMIEQPLAGDALLEMAELQQSLSTALCLDESASSVNTTRTALALSAGRIVNIKPPRLGGIGPALAVHDLCADQDVPVWCGGMLETGIGRGFNLALAALPGFTLHSDMSPARMSTPTTWSTPPLISGRTGLSRCRPGRATDSPWRPSASRTPRSAAGKAMGGPRRRPDPRREE